MLRTKIVCTLGPATSSPERVRAPVEGVVNVARINTSGSTNTMRVEML